MVSQRLNHVHLERPSLAEAISLASILLAVVAVIALAGRPPSSGPPLPHLVAYGCKGASGPLYADEEDYFPYPCSTVERTH
jgi:hypothetical protein